MIQCVRSELHFMHPNLDLAFSPRHVPTGISTAMFHWGATI